MRELKQDPNKQASLRPAALVLTLLCLLLQGCFNLYEHVTEGGWKSVGTNLSPPAERDFDMSLLVRGKGRTVRAGDLVYARVSVAAPTVVPIPAEPTVFNAWIWSGTTPSDDLHISDRDTWAELGSQRIRATLSGKSIGDIYSFQLHKGAQRSVHRIPLYGLAEDSSLEPRYQTSLWPVLEIDHKYAEIEILDTCPARLLRRTAVLTQWGIPINMFDSYHPTSRAGTLGWTALEANCVAPRGPVRFEIGPLYSKPHGLLDWDISYQRAHLKDSWWGVMARLLIGTAVFALFFRLARGTAPARRQ